MEVTLINHSSLLFKFTKTTILTDFWSETPAFGSWLPSAPPIYHPMYLASLSYQKDFVLCVSHAHDDHIDNVLLEKYFNKDMKIILNEFPSPSLKKRIQKLGFNNIINIKNEQILKMGDFECISVFDNNISNDDCGIAFRNKKYCIYHGNDNHFILSNKNITKLKNFAKNRKFLFCSQTNTASGFPINYYEFSPTEIKKELENKILLMVENGLINTKNCKADLFLPYAGYSKTYVKDKKYHLMNIDPIYQNLCLIVKKSKKIKDIKKMVNIFCGGKINLLNGKVSYPFSYDPKKMIKLFDNYLTDNKIINKCDTFLNEFDKTDIDEKKIDHYLNEFLNFVYGYLERFPNFYNTILNKILCLEVHNKSNSIKKFLDIKNKKIIDDGDYNKKFVIPSNLFNAMYDKKIPFDNLYTGCEAEISRRPKNVYNRDLLMYLTMFGYKYKNS